MATREGGLGGKGKMNNCSYFGFFDVNKNEGEERTNCSSSFTGALTTLSVRVRPANTRLHCFQLLVSWIFEHAVVHRPSACPPAPSCPRPACGCMQTNCTYSVLSILASCPLHIIGTRNKGHRCGPDEYKI